MYALCDCNNFFCSCERLYHPEYRNRPVAVLSNNDGCIIARSNEVKAMGIKMGEPYFKVEGFLQKNNVVVCSGNLSLYKEVSDKVMEALRRFAPVMEAYSIDEAFLRLPMIAWADAPGYAARIRKFVDQIVGIPISIGIAATKTLAKLASERAKKTESGILEITEANRREILKATEAGDIWGIGPRAAEKLRRCGIVTADDFIRKDSLWVKKQLTIRGLMTHRELMGHPSIPLLEKAPPPKSVQVSRTWGAVLETFEDVMGAMREQVVKAGRQIREENLSAGAMSIFLRHGKPHGVECGYFEKNAEFREPIQSDPELIFALGTLIELAFRPGHKYTQGSVTLDGLVDGRHRQRGLFDQEDFERRERLEKASRAVDVINETVGTRLIGPASLVVMEKPWRSNKNFLTEKWSSLIEVK